MTTAIKSAISPFAQPKTEPKANAILFLDEQLASMPAAGIPEDFRKLSHFFSVIVLVPKSAVDDEATQIRKLQDINSGLSVIRPQCGRMTPLYCLFNATHKRRQSGKNQTSKFLLTARETDCCFSYI